MKFVGSPQGLTPLFLPVAAVARAMPYHRLLQPVVRHWHDLTKAMLEKLLKNGRARPSTAQRDMVDGNGCWRLAMASGINIIQQDVTPISGFLPLGRPNPDAVPD